MAGRATPVPEFNPFSLGSAFEDTTPDQQSAGVVVNLKSGDRVYAEVPSALLARVMAALTPEELGTLVDAIVDAVENPDARSLCQRLD